LYKANPGNCFFCPL